VPARYAAIAFGGKDSDTGCNDMFTLELAPSVACAGCFDLRVRCVPCPFDVDMSEGSATATLLRPAGEGWPHWRYLGSLAVVPAAPDGAEAAATATKSSSTYEVLMISGTCRHNDAVIAEDGTETPTDVAVCRVTLV
jgi:hypothetical protein